jgi:hypothetical protein
MEDTLIKVTDEKETLLRPIDATFKVEYKYEGEATAEVVLEGDVKRGTVIKDEFPAPDASKDLEYSEIVIDVKDKPNNLAYASKTSRFAGRVPPKGTPVPLPFLGNIPKNKEEKQLAMAEKRKSILERLKEIYPPK